MTQMMSMLLLAQMSKRNENDSSTGVGKALRKLHGAQGRAYTASLSVVNEYLQEVMSEIGAEDGDIWEPAALKARISWRRTRELGGIHYRFPKAFRRALLEQSEALMGYTALVLRAIHQVCVDGGSWKIARHLLPGKDPLFCMKFGGTKEDERIYSYEKDEEGSDDHRGRGCGRERERGRNDSTPTAQPTGQ